MLETTQLKTSHEGLQTLGTGVLVFPSRDLLQNLRVQLHGCFFSSNAALACTLAYLLTPSVTPAQPFVRPAVNKVKELMQAKLKGY